MKRAFVLFSIFAILSACNKEIEGYVKGANPDRLNPTPTPTPVATNNGSKTLKLSPGTILTSGTSTTMKATITTTNQVLTGTQYSAKVSISQGRRQ